MSIVYKRGELDITYEHYMDFVNEVFQFTEPEQKFDRLLPKLYREGRTPQNGNYMIMQDGRLAAAIGAFDHDIRVCGQTLRCRGIGNVAVHKDFRMHGYMAECMNFAVEEMVKDGIALSTLGGRRQRYRYFSYDKCGICQRFVLEADNIRHTFGNLEAPFSGCRQVSDDADLVWDAIVALAEKGLYCPVRRREDWPDITRTWHGRPYVVFDEDRFVGYAIVEPNREITEVRTERKEDFMPLIRTLFATLGGEDCLTVALPAFEADYIKELCFIAEAFRTDCSMNYTILDYRAVLDAFFHLKATYTSLPDGQLKMLIHGRAGDERLSLRVQDGVPSVQALPDSESDKDMAIELSHIEAMNAFFAPISPLRDSLSPLFRSWFPLPLWMYRADEI